MRPLRLSNSSQDISQAIDWRNDFNSLIVIMYFYLDTKCFNMLQDAIRHRQSRCVLIGMNRLHEDARTTFSGESVLLGLSIRLYDQETEHNREY
jgi:hypothetical protein